MKHWTKFDHFTAACWCVLGVATLVRLSLGFWSVLLPRLFGPSDMVFADLVGLLVGSAFACSVMLLAFGLWWWARPSSLRTTS